METSDLHSDFTRQITQQMGMLHRVALQFTKDPEDAKDLVQDTLLKAYRYWQKFKPDTNLGAWLFTIMRNTFLTQYNRIKRERQVITSPPLYEQDTSATNSLPNGAISQSIQEDIGAVVAQLTAIYREPFLLHVAGFKYYEIALRLSIPIGTVKNRLFIARQELQRRIHR